MSSENIENFSRNLSKALSENHDSWSQTYEEEVTSAHYQAPELLVETALTLLDSGEILDLGCGTGLVAEAVQRRNKQTRILIDGCDISEAMLELAEKKNIYRSLTCCDIFSMPYDESSYDMLIAAGMFVSNEDHRQSGAANAQALPGAIKLLKLGGFCVFSVSERVWETDSEDYESVIQFLPVKLVQQRKQPYHDAIPSMLNIVLQRQ